MQADLHTWRNFPSADDYRKAMMDTAMWKSRALDGYATLHFAALRLFEKCASLIPIRSTRIGCLAVQVRACKNSRVLEDEQSPSAQILDGYSS